MVIRAQGKVFEFNLNRLRHGYWVVELISVDGYYCSGNYSDPIPNEREARRDARQFAATAYYHPGLGWCSK
jgi:hypothetical protein